MYPPKCGDFLSPTNIFIIIALPIDIYVRPILCMRKLSEVNPVDNSFFFFFFLNPIYDVDIFSTLQHIYRALYISIYTSYIYYTWYIIPWGISYICVRISNLRQLSKANPDDNAAAHQCPLHISPQKTVTHRLGWNCFWRLSWLVVVNLSPLSIVATVGWLWSLKCAWCYFFLQVVYVWALLTLLTTMSSSSLKTSATKLCETCMIACFICVKAK